MINARLGANTALVGTLTNVLLTELKEVGGGDINGSLVLSILEVCSRQANFSWICANITSLCPKLYS